MKFGRNGTTEKSGVKGNELAGGHTAGQAPEASKRGVDHTRYEESKEPVGVVGREAQSFERKRRPTTPTGKDTLPDKTFSHKTQYLSPISQRSVVFPD
jgi:hypothetical protein